MIQDLFYKFKVVEINNSSAIRKGHIIAQTVADLRDGSVTTKEIEGTPYLENGLIVGLEKDKVVNYRSGGHALPLLVYTEELVSIDYLSGLNQFANEENRDGECYPRCIPMYVGDTFTTNNFIAANETSNYAYAKVTNGTLELTTSKESDCLWSVTKTTMPDGELGYEFMYLGSAGGSGGTGTEGPQGPAGANGADGVDGKDGVDGVDGQDGESAYEIAVRNGFVGNESAWLESLKGETGATGGIGATGETGADGAVGPTGADGSDGKSAYDIWIDLGNTGSEADFIASLKGADGLDGGEAAKGDDGKSAYEIAVENGFEGDEAAWLASLKGEDGVIGSDGKDASAVIAIPFNENAAASTTVIGAGSLITKVVAVVSSASLEELKVTIAGSELLNENHSDLTPPSNFVVENYSIALSNSVVNIECTEGTGTVYVFYVEASSMLN